MMAAMYSGVSGLKNHQTKMDVIANNISNVNTVGYKASRVIFQDVMSQTTRGASAATAALGGTNPNQIGLGVNIATIDTLFANTASLERTDRELDFAISGDGYFYVIGANGEELFTRVGAFYLDNESCLVNSDGYRVQGYTATKGYDMTYLKMSNLQDATDTLYVTPGIDGVYTYSCTWDDIDDPLNPGTSIKALVFTVKDEAGNVYTTTYDENNLPSWISQDPVTNEFYIDATQTGCSIDLEDDDGNILFTINFDMDADDDISISDFANDYLKGTVGAFDFTYDEFVGDLYLDGYTYISVEQDGTIKGLDENSNWMELGKIALATFSNDSGLTKVGNSCYQASANSGEAVIGWATENGSGTLEQGYLEMSNVDLSTEFTDMIVTQRGFQANSRIITTCDSMLEELVNLKR